MKQHWLLSMNDGKSWLNNPRECAVHKLHGTFLFYFCYQVVNHNFLHLLIGFAGTKFGGNEFQIHSGEQLREHSRELRVGKQRIVSRRKFLGSVGADFVKFFWNNHKLNDFRNSLLLFPQAHNLYLFRRL